MTEHLTAYLPDTVRTLVDEIGFDAALALVKIRGGITLHVPRNATEGHWLAAHIGVDAFQKLVLAYGGDRLELPRCAALLRLERDQAIIDSGDSAAMLARRHGMTTRAIFKIRARYKGGNGHDGGMWLGTGDLFNGFPEAGKPVINNH